VSSNSVFVDLSNAAHNVGSTSNASNSNSSINSNSNSNSSNSNSNSLHANNVVNIDINSTSSHSSHSSHSSSANLGNNSNNNDASGGDADDDDNSKKKPLSQRGSVAASLLYIVTAVALVLFNKNVLSGRYSLNVPALMPLVQQLVIWAGLVALAASGTIKALPPVTVTTLSHMAVVSLAFLAYLLLGMLALKGVSIPMYASLRRFTVVFVMFFDYLVDAKFHSHAVIATVVVQVVGCALAAMHDVEYNPSGYAYIALYNAATALYLVAIKFAKTKHVYLDNFGMMYLNSITLIPALAVLAYFMGDYDAMAAFPYAGEWGFLVSFVASAVLAFVLNYAIFWNTSANSALTQTVSGQLKDIGTVLLGYIAFPPTEFSWLNFFGVVVGFAGSLAYALVKYNESNSAKK
jgi:solute carrier family 35 protein